MDIELIKYVGTFVGSIVSYVLTSNGLKKIKQDWKIFKFRKAIEIDSKVDFILQEIRIKYGFNRTAIIDYHNGTESFNGFSFKYASMSYEKTDNHTKEIITSFKNIPTTIMSNVLLQLEHSKKGYVFESVNGFDEQGIVTLNMFGINTAHNFRIGNSLIKGCLTCAYTSEDVNHNKNLLTEEQILDIKQYVQQILLLRNK